MTIRSRRQDGLVLVAGPSRSRLGAELPYGKEEAFSFDSGHTPNARIAAVSVKEQITRHSCVASSVDENPLGSEQYRGGVICLERRMVGLGMGAGLHPAVNSGIELRGCGFRVTCYGP